MAGVNPELFGAMKYRCIGPHRGGRVVAVAGDLSNPNVHYFGSTGGGVWKTDDGGEIWKNVSDGFFKTASVGALQVSESDPNVIYAGMGETSIRGNVSRGDGVYKSTDAGRTWKHCGLEATQNIGEIAIHPTNPDLVYVAAFGHVWGENEERGLYRSKDGGATWEKVLHRSNSAGAIDLSMDPTNPRILYVSFWEAGRNPYSMSSGGEGSGLFRSFDGGDTWEEISRKPGLPKGVLGKIGVAASGAKAGRVWAIVEAEDGAVFRSDDYGDTWTRGSEDRNLRQRAWYYHHIYADPNDADTVWVLNVENWKSIDGGKTFGKVPGPHGDNHDLWIDRNNSNRMILGHDGGACVSYNGGNAWSNTYNQPTAEFYHVVVDTQTPYRVYGAQQDNTTMSVISRSISGAITTQEWYPIGGGESGYIAVRPDNHNIVFAGSYGGNLTRYDHSTGFLKAINVWPEMTLGSADAEMHFRFQWTSPTVLSPHDPNILYTGGNHVFKSTNEGQSWQMISPDLTRADPETLGPSGGPITKDNTGAETYATVFAIAESPLQAGLIWIGTDDGLIHITHDGGENWENINPPDLPDWALISIIEASPHDAGTAYVAATRYKSHDDAPYLYKTNDYGKTWKKIVNGIPEDDFTRVIREDPEQRGLLFAGTERALYVSFDDGENWQELRLNLPVVPIHDLVIAQGDLVVCTHGRSFWILDDISPLRQIAADAADDKVRLFKPRDTIRYPGGGGFSGHAPIPGRNYAFAAGMMTTYDFVQKPGEPAERIMLDAGQNPDNGVVVQYYLPEAPEGEVTLTFKDSFGNVVRSFTSTKPDDAYYKDKPGLTRPTPIPAKAGANRFVWDMRHENATEVPDDSGSMGFARGPNGPRSKPGEYVVELKVGDAVYSREFRILPYEKIAVPQEDYDEQLDLQLKVRDKLSELHTAVNQIRNIRKQVGSWTARMDDEKVSEAAKALNEKLYEVEGELIQYRAKSTQDTLNFPVMINAKLAALIAVIGSAEGKPTQQSYDVFEDLAGRTDTQLAKLKEIIEKDVAAFSDLIRSADLPAVAP